MAFYSSLSASFGPHTLQTLASTTLQKYDLLYVCFEDSSSYDNRQTWDKSEKHVSPCEEFSKSKCMWAVFRAQESHMKIGSKNGLAIRCPKKMDSLMGRNTYPYWLLMYVCRCLEQWSSVSSA